MSDEFRDNAIIKEMMRLRGGWIEIADLVERVDPSDPHLEAKIHAQVADKNLERSGTRVRLSKKIPRLKP